MSAKTEQILRRLTSSIREGGKEKTSAYDTSATVRRVEDGVAWVHIPGGVDETPVKLTINAKPGDVVQVRISGGRATLTGNASAPPTDDTTATKAVTQIGAVRKVVKTVQGVAERAARIAGNTAQYFWHTESGTDTGAHITEIPQDQFEADPENGGGNLLLRSNGIAIRDGLTELATFAASLIQMGASGGWTTKVTDTGFQIWDETTPSNPKLKMYLDAAGLDFYEEVSGASFSVAEITPLIGGGLAIKNLITHQEFRMDSSGAEIMNQYGHGMSLSGGDLSLTGKLSATNIQCGYAMLTGGANVVRTKSVQFDTAFTTDPHVTATPYVQYPQNAHVSLSSITRTGFDINLYYTSTTDVNVQWIAIGM